MATRAAVAVPGHPGWVAVFCPPDAVEVYRPDGTGLRYVRTNDTVKLSAVALTAVKGMLEGAAALWTSNG